MVYRFRRCAIADPATGRPETVVSGGYMLRWPFVLRKQLRVDELERVNITACSQESGRTVVS
jgi:hypothetical protein